MPRTVDTVDVRLTCKIKRQPALETGQECPSSATTTDDAAAAAAVAEHQASQKIITTQETPKGSLEIDVDLTTGEQTSSSSSSSGENTDYLSKKFGFRKHLFRGNTQGYSTPPSSSLHPESETLAQRHRQHRRDMIKTLFLATLDYTNRTLANATMTVPTNMNDTMQDSTTATQDWKDLNLTQLLDVLYHNSSLSVTAPATHSISGTQLGRNFTQEDDGDEAEQIQDRSHPNLER
ncbi:hypothetical protein BGZ80_006318 [Entomortierella chlamydospora]|uniref:Uncharacterized protein n=1 Tax=Entomortierella chlamydospora TaxID=101097 RepID=A0A9P6N0F7_9FUNG|nr:hypothetical protein BGZ80_006318 [Entomortierella chlamydospora]